MLCFPHLTAIRRRRYRPSHQRASTSTAGLFPVRATSPWPKIERGLPAYVSQTCLYQGDHQLLDLHKRVDTHDSVSMLKDHLQANYRH